MKSIVGILKELEESPVKSVESGDAAESEVTEVSEKSSLEVRKRKAFEMTMLGYSYDHIAKVFEVSVSTIYRWMASVNEGYRKSIEQVPGADVLSEHLLWLSRIEQMCLYEVNILSNKDGEKPKDNDSRSQANQIKFLQAALNARKMKIDMLTKANVLPVEPEKIYHAMSDEKPKLSEDIAAKADKTREELETNIERLLNKGLSM